MRDLMWGFAFLFSFGLQCIFLVYLMGELSPWLDETFPARWSWKKYGPTFGLCVSFLLFLPAFVRLIKKMEGK